MEAVLQAHRELDDKRSTLVGDEGRRVLTAVPAAADPDDPHLVSGDRVRVFDKDPDLLDGLNAAATDLLRRRMTVPKGWIESGAWEPPSSTSLNGPCFGLLMLDGLMIRSLSTMGRNCPELVGAGDLLRPWDFDSEASVPMSVSWTALERTTVAVLDGPFAEAICRFPVITENLLARTMQRSRTLAFHLAVAHVRHAETRLHMLLWHLADRWGRVTTKGVHLPFALTHETLAHLVCMRRPTASTALQRLRAAGQVDRCPDGTWLLTSQPPADAPGVG